MHRSARLQRVTPHRFRPDIEGLRAVAVLLVVFDHLLGNPVGGFVGVDVFLVISGFLISGLLIAEGERTGRVSIREFYARRVRRIIPAAVLVLVATTIAAQLVFLASRAEETLHDALWAGVFLANVHFAQAGTDYFQEGLPPSPLQHYWTLSVEEQFYVVWPLALLVLFVLSRRLRRWPVRRLIVLVAGLTTVASFAWCVQLTQAAPTEAYFATPARAWELSLGALLAVGQQWLLRLPERLRAAASWVGLAGIGVAAVAITPETAFPGYAAALPVASAALVLGAGNPRRGPGRTHVLGNPVVQYVGRLSYSLYLWHWPCIVLATAYWGPSGFEFYVTAAVLPALLSILSFHVVENPIRQSSWLSARRADRPPLTLARWYRDNRRGLDLALVGTAATAFVIAGWLDVTKTSDTGAPAVAIAAPAAQPVAAAPQLTPHEQQVAAAASATEWGRISPSLDRLDEQVAPEWKPDGCINITPRTLASCVYGDPDGARTAVVIGDSVALSWLPGIRAALDGAGWRIQVLTFGECPVPALPTARSARTRGTEFEACTEHRAWADGVVRELRPDLLILSSQPTFASRIVGISGYDSADNYAAWQAGMTTRLQTLAAYADRTVVLAAPPKSGNLQTCVTARSTPQDCTLALSRNWSAVTVAERAAAAAGGAVHVDTERWFCHEHRCPAVIAGTPVMWDGAHVTASYARSLAPLLRRHLVG